MDEKLRDEEERREKGRALVESVLLSSLQSIEKLILAGVRQRQSLMSQLIMDGFDIWIPATNLGYTQLNDGLLGFLG